MQIDKIEKRTLRQQVYDVLKSKMTSAEILPGEKISLRDLSDKLGVSLMPVREAICKLESEKIIIIESNKNIRVNTLTPLELKETLKIRISLETMASQMACKKRSAVNIEYLQKTLVIMQESLDTPEEYCRNNKLFHFTIYKMAQSPILLDIISGLWARVGPYIFLATRERHDLLAAMRFHDLMYKALVDQDVKMMARAIEDDLTTTAESILNLLMGTSRKHNRMSRSLQI